MLVRANVRVTIFLYQAKVLVNKSRHALFELPVVERSRSGGASVDNLQIEFGFREISS